MDTIAAYEGILAAEKNGFKLDEEISRKILLDSLLDKNPQNGISSGSFNSMMKREDEITDADREWAETHICIVDNKEIDWNYLNFLTKKCDEARKKNPDIPDTVDSKM